MAETAVKASGTGAGRPVDVCFVRTGVERRRSSPMPQGSVLWGLGAHEVRWTSVWRGSERSGDFPNKQGCRVTKALLAEERKYEKLD